MMPSALTHARFLTSFLWLPSQCHRLIKFMAVTKTLGVHDIYQLARTGPCCSQMGDRYTTVLNHTAEVLLLSPSTLVHLSLEDADGLSGAFAGGGVGVGV